MRKKGLLAAITALAVLSISTAAFAQNSIFIDLQEVITDTPAQIVNNRTMVPVRAITEMLGCNVEWLAPLQQVEVYDGSNEPSIIMNIGSTTAYFSKFDIELDDYVGYEIELDSPAVIINERTFVPLRFISEALGYTVDYNVDTTDIYMFSPQYIANMQGEGIGMGNDTGDGIGEAIPPTPEEKNYVMSIRTMSWTKLTQAQQDNILSIIYRWWETGTGYISENPDEFATMLGNQMGSYFRSDTDMGVFETACELAGLDINNYAEIKG